MNSVKLKSQLKKERWIAIIKESKESPMLLKDWLKENNISKDQYYFCICTGKRGGMRCRNIQE